MIDLGTSNDLAKFNAVVRNPEHPFCKFANDNRQAINIAWQRYKIGAIVVNGETGAATAAMDIADSCRIPVTGFAPPDKINERGLIEDSRAVRLIEAGGAFALIDKGQANRERQTL
ncbi:MAG: YpsA SLOG family protein [Pseudomonadota bacterium]|jgi:hypothetical protein